MDVGIWGAGTPAVIQGDEASLLGGLQILRFLHGSNRLHWVLVRFWDELDGFTDILCPPPTSPQLVTASF